MQTLLPQESDIEAILHLIKMLASSDDTQAREASAKTLVRIGKQAVPYLIQALRHEDWRIREGSTYVLGAIGDPEAIPHIALNLDDRMWRVREASIAALARIRRASAVK